MNSTFNSNNKNIEENRIYLDNAATSFPKPACVLNAMQDYMINNGANIGRGGYREAYEAEEAIIGLRSNLCSLFNCPDPRNVILTSGCTISINMLLQGLLEPGDHVICSAMEHNAVVRSLELFRNGITVSYMSCDNEGNLNMSEAEIKALIRPETKLMIVTAASNVTGTMIPVQRLGRLCHEEGILFLVDSAQLAGCFKLDMQGDNIDAIAFAGHKGLLGPQGTGGFIINQKVADRIRTVVAGGTGSFSDSFEMPPVYPDRLEAGTMNIPGLIGLGAAVEYILSRDNATVADERMAITKHFLEGLSELEKAGKIIIHGRHDIKNRCPVVSISTPDKDMAEVAYLLDQNFGIKTRVGLHCAPLAHKTIGTYPKGTIRFSIGEATIISDMDYTIEALAAITQ